MTALAQPALAQSYYIIQQQQQQQQQQTFDRSTDLRQSHRQHTHSIIIILKRLLHLEQPATLNPTMSTANHHQPITPTGRMTYCTELKKI